MNCKPGDIARIVNSLCGNSDKLVLVIEASPLNGRPNGAVAVVAGAGFYRDGEGFCWVVEALGGPINKSSGKSYRVCPVADVYLRPIRDPGDDARDESLEWKPVPVTVPGFTKEHA